MADSPLTGPGHAGRSAEAAEFYRLRRRLRLAFGALVLVTAVGVLGFLLIGGAGQGIVNAIYMTIITLTTVGFGEIIDMSSNPAGRVFTVVLLLVGMGIVAYTVPMAAAFVIEGQLHNIFARRRMQKTIAEMANHHIVCGDTTACWHVAEELIRTNREVVVVAPTAEALAEARHRLGDCLGIVGDPSSDEVLLEAGAERAAGIVVCTNNDKDNVLGVLTARRLAPRARIIAATEQPETEVKLQTVGADVVVSPSRIGGLRMASALVRPTVVTFLDKMLREKGGTLRVEEVTIPKDAHVSDRTLAGLEVDEVAGAMLLAVRHPETGEFTFKPPPDTSLTAGMTLVVMADPGGLDRLRKRFRRATGSQFKLEQTTE
jgi:voltage-gated potassium channel